MTDDIRPEPRRASEDFARMAEAPSSSLMREVYDMIRYSRKWWLVPVLVVLLIFGLLIFLGGTPAAPLIYTLF